VRHECQLKATALRSEFSCIQVGILAKNTGSSTSNNQEMAHTHALRARASMVSRAAERPMALLLLVISLLLPLAPLLQARSAWTEVCRCCCQREAHDACRRSLERRTGGRCWEASFGCAREGRRLKAIICSAPFVAPELSRRDGLPVQSDGFSGKNPVNRKITFYAAGQYQRLLHSPESRIHL
jgi:hypothetical protein